MPFLLHQRAQFELERGTYEVLPLRSNHDVWQRLVDLASMARALDPSLPSQLRFAKTAVDNDPLLTPFQAILTDSHNPDLRVEVLTTGEDRSIPLMEGLARALPPEVLAKEMLAIQVTDEQNFASPLDAAIYTAFRETLVDLKTVVEIDTEAAVTLRHVSSAVYTIPALSFLSNRSLAHRAWLAPLSNAVRDEQGLAPMEGPFARLRAAVQQVRTLLGAPMAEASEAQRAEVVRLIGSLNGRHEPQPFEARHAHGWIAFALGHRAGDWITTLLEAGCSPTQPYDQALPLALAIAGNDVKAVDALVNAGVSPRGTFSGVPHVLNEEGERWLRGFDDSMVPAVMWGAVMGASESVQRLLHHEANPNAMTETGRFALMVAAQNGDLATARHLVAYGADLTQEDAHGRLPEEVVPEMLESDPQFQAMNELYESLSHWRITGVRPAIEPIAPVARSTPTAPQVEPAVADGALSEGEVLNQTAQIEPATVTQKAPRLPSKAALARKVKAPASTVNDEGLNHTTTDVSDIPVTDKVVKPKRRTTGA